MDFIQIGKVATTHGIKGSILITHGIGKKVNFKGVKALFIEETKNSRIPWFIEGATARNNEETIVQLEGLNSKESAHRLIRNNIWLQKSDFEKIADKNAPISLIGYTLFDDKKPLSEIEEIIEQPNQLLVRLTIEDKEVLIPLHEEILDNIDHNKKAVYVRLPDGLLDIYLS
ncbi:MAG: 16S rRNA processing protein RimM [Pseudopedobacter saltans]|uniref:Ribosome maturation factor RimM n=1 Tax=Pseudopedobacter saltans TaxID=151895 RepID=A0A2W5GSS2_9SPHI|nr:MAG: 16S rRNA processing protein RimM [Pseudopedobacter saltans]